MCLRLKKKLLSWKKIKMIPEKTINDLIIKHANLERELSSGNIDKKFFAEKSKEYSDLNEIIEDAKNIYHLKKIKPN